MRWTQQRQARIGNRRAGLLIRERSSSELTNGAVAYGKIVLSWHPDAGVKFAEVKSAQPGFDKTLIRGRRWQESPVAGEDTT